MAQFVRNQKQISDLRDEYEKNQLKVKAEHDIAIQALRQALAEKEDQVCFAYRLVIFGLHGKIYNYM